LEILEIALTFLCSLEKL